MVIAFLLLSMPTTAERTVYPRDPSVLNAKIDLGANADGVADDTAA